MVLKKNNYFHIARYVDQVKKKHHNYMYAYTDKFEWNIYNFFPM